MIERILKVNGANFKEHLPVIKNLDGTFDQLPQTRDSLVSNFKLDCSSINVSQFCTIKISETRFISLNYDNTNSNYLTARIIEIASNGTMSVVGNKVTVDATGASNGYVSGKLLKKTDQETYDRVIVCWNHSNTLYCKALKVEGDVITVGSRATLASSSYSVSCELAEDGAVLFCYQTSSHTLNSRMGVVSGSLSISLGSIVDLGANQGYYNCSPYILKTSEGRFVVVSKNSSYRPVAAVLATSGNTIIVNQGTKEIYAVTLDPDSSANVCQISNSYMVFNYIQNGSTMYFSRVPYDSVLGTLGSSTNFSLPSSSFPLSLGYNSGKEYRHTWLLGYDPVRREILYKSGNYKAVLIRASIASNYSISVKLERISSLVLPSLTSGSYMYTTDSHKTYHNGKFKISMIPDDCYGKGSSFSFNCLDLSRIDSVFCGIAQNGNQVVQNGIVTGMSGLQVGASYGYDPIRGDIIKMDSTMSCLVAPDRSISMVAISETEMWVRTEDSYTMTGYNNRGAESLNTI